MKERYKRETALNRPHVTRRSNGAHFTESDLKTQEILPSIPIYMPPENTSEAPDQSETTAPYYLYEDQDIQTELKLAYNIPIDNSVIEKHSPLHPALPNLDDIPRIGWVKKDTTQ